MDLCPDCAFCSLKREQCQNSSNLRRVRCGKGNFITYINPQISAQHQAMGNKVLSTPPLQSACAMGGGDGEEEAQLSSSHPFADRLPRALWHAVLPRAASRVLVQPDSHPGLRRPSCDALAAGRVCRLPSRGHPKPGGCRVGAPISPSPLPPLAFIPISPDLRLGWSSAPQLLRLQEPPVSAAQPPQPEGEKQPVTLPSPPRPRMLQPSPSPCRAHWPSAFPPNSTQVVVSGEGGSKVLTQAQRVC